MRINNTIINYLLIINRMKNHKYIIMTHRQLIIYFLILKMILRLNLVHYKSNIQELIKNMMNNQKGYYNQKIIKMKIQSQFNIVKKI